MDENMSVPPPYDPKDKNSFAYVTIVDRWPSIITNLINSVSQTLHDLSTSSALGTQGVFPAKIAEGKRIIETASKLKYDMARDRPLGPIIGDGGSNIELYNQQLQAFETTSQNTWFSCPWLYAECYLYRLMRSWFATTQHWSQFDPFFAQKEETFKSSGAAVYQLALTMSELDREAEKSSLDTDLERLEVLFDEMIQMCLWGNATDLSLLTTLSSADIERLQSVGKEAQAASRQYILRDDIDVAWNHVKGLKNARLDIVLDNAGFEYFTDLILADFLVTHTPFFGSVTFHSKDIPWFVSDVTPPDVRAILSALASVPTTLLTTSTAASAPEGNGYFASLPPSQGHLDALHKLRYRWLKYFENGTFKIYGCPGLDGNFSGGPKNDAAVVKGAMRDDPDSGSPAAFWTGPDPYWKLIEHPGMAGLEGSKLVIFKGDLNYRKLTGDLQWPMSTPFGTALGAFAGKLPVLSLRTSKADVVVGLREGVGEAMDKDESKRGWKVNGRYALISYEPQVEASS
ncbi:hypothetical protein FRB94_005901 [Tulasnella sp. JGI-2019a]|nr:hypothetical protein FRB94_005901 [Tulasnella sp. JGI-2019a]